MSPRAQFLEEVAVLFARLQQAPGQVHVRVWQELGPWLRDLASKASLKWVERLGASDPCHIVTIEDGRHQSCSSAAIAYCIVCRKPTCLKHAFVDGSGEAVCFACVQESITASGKPPPPPPSAPRAVEDVRWAHRTLKVKMGSSWDDVRSAHRKLSARWHPDKVQDATGKKKAEDKFKEIGRAFEILKKEYGK